MTAKKTTQTRKIRFGDAIDELEGILRRVEAEEIDLDELAEELKKATELLEICRAKIRTAEVEVTQIVQAIEQSDESDAEQKGED